MFDSDIFVFGSKIFPEIKTDPITSLPLELSWKIFSYLDGLSLRTAMKSHKRWCHIILSNRKLKKKLNHFEMVARFGSDRLVQFYKKTKRKLKKETTKNYLPINECHTCKAG